MKKVFLLIIVLNIFSFSLLGQYFSATPTFKPRSYEDMTAPLRKLDEMFRQAKSQINDLKQFIIDILSRDIDDKLREELNQDYTKLKSLSDYIDRNGIGREDFNTINSIYNDTNDHIISYNNRIAQQKREYELQQKRIAEEKERQRRIEESKPKVWSGTGFALNNGYLVTNWHVAENAQTIYVYGIRGDFSKKYIAEVVAKDKNNDLALLKISGNGFPGFGTVPYKIKTGIAEVAEDIWVLGFPLTAIMGDEVKYTDGRISALSGFDGDVSMYQISAPIQNGNSGGPVFDENGNVIGIACAGIDNRVAQNANYAVKASYLKSLADAMQITNVMPTNSQITSYTRRQDKVKLAKNFVFYIECCDKELPLEGVANIPSYINVSPTCLNFSEKQESKTLTISTNAPSWKIASKPNWCTATGKTATSVTINVTKNESHENRSGTILLETSDGRTAAIQIVYSLNTGDLNGFKWVDLGLPSGIKWATCNIGASSPTDYGNYYAWGETTTKNIYDRNTYTYTGTPTILPADMDAATANWGSGWRMPTLAEMQELLDNCTYTWVTMDDVNGWLFTGPNSYSIFLPAAGYRSGNDIHYNNGCYWSSSISSITTGLARSLDFNSDHCSLGFAQLRIQGQTVRAVCR